jgi:hypothetical protein
MKKPFLILLLIFSLPNMLLAQSLDEAFSNQPDLTDKQMDEANNFVHQGVKDRKIEEGCKDKNLKGCEMPEDGMPLEKMISMAYTTLGMIGGGMNGPTLNKKPTQEAKDAGKKGKEAKVEKEKQTDYCILAAMAYETLGGMIQQSLQKKAESESAAIKDIQLQSLVNLREAHKARKKTATIQASIYSAVSACYVAMGITGSAIDTGYILKTAGAATLTALYWKKVSKHKKAEEAVDRVIASLPGADENCNPWTKTPCFCSESTSKELYPVQYEEVCVLNKGDFDTPKVALGCAEMTTENKLQYDKECKCKQTNSCLKSNLKPYSSKFSLANNFMDEANKTLDLINSGEFDQGKLDRASISNSALASKVKFKAEEALPSPTLTAEQQKIADELKAVMPGAVANIAATRTPSYNGGVNESSSMGSSALAKLPPSVKEKVAEAIKVDYKRGGGLKSNTNDGPEFTMPSFGPKDPEIAPGTEIVSFAEQAISKADVSNAPETPIFDIISNRYRRSGWQKLDQVEK